MRTSNKKKAAASATAAPNTAMIGRTHNTRHRKRQRLFGYRKPTRRVGGGNGKPSWRDQYAVHEAAAFFHQFSGDDQLKELAEDIDEQGAIFEPVHTASVPGKGKPFVIDGISRLDAAEKTGRQIIRENGEWMGLLSNVGGSRSVIHHPGKTDEEIWSIVISLNLKRRHYTTGQLSAIADTLATRPTGRPGKSALMRNYVFTQEQAAKTVGVSRRSVQQFRQVKKESPEKVAAIRAGRLSVARATRDAKPKHKPKPLDTSSSFVWKRFGQFLNRWPHQQQRVVRQTLLALLLGHWENNKLILPATLTWPDGKTEKVGNILSSP